MILLPHIATPYPEWWRDGPFEATATGHANSVAPGANSRKEPWEIRSWVKAFAPPVVTGGAFLVHTVLSAPHELFTVHDSRFTVTYIGELEDG